MSAMGLVASTPAAGVGLASAPAAGLPLRLPRSCSHPLATETTLSRQNICFTADPAVGDAHRIVCDLVRQFRSDGLKNEHAIAELAQVLGIPPRRAWALRYLTQPVRVLPTQRERLLHRRRLHQRICAAKLRAKADALERAVEADLLAEVQLPLPLSEPASATQGE